MEKNVMVEEWTSQFRAIDLDDDSMANRHTLFERENPSGYQGFREWLGLPGERIVQIRAKLAFK